MKATCLCTKRGEFTLIEEIWWGHKNVKALSTFYETKNIDEVQIKKSNKVKIYGV